MTTFKDSLKKWFFTQGQTAATATSRIPLLDASGNPIGSDTLDNMVKKKPVYTANVGVAVIGNGDYDYYEQAERAEELYQNAVGVWIMEAGRLIVVGLHESSMAWASDNVAGGTDYFPNLANALHEFEGRARTATIIQTLGEDAPAAKYCNEYYAYDQAHAQFGAGNWHLPSVYQFGMIYSHLHEVQRIMKIIGGDDFNMSAEPTP